MINSYLQSGNTEQCCGCAACSDICAMGAITFVKSYDEAMYPTVDTKKCIGCGACSRVCPIENSTEHNKDKDCFEVKTYAGFLYDDKKRMESASGGVFEAIAASIEKRNPEAFVCGAVWDKDLTVKHVVVPIYERNALKKSKYIQSDSRGCYRAVKKLLMKGKTVLFTGTPCQVKAMMCFLGEKKYDGLVTVDLICHGVPGRNFFEKYICEEETKRKDKVTEAEFRVKRKDLYGEVHSDYLKLVFASGRITYGNKKTDAYLRGFHKSLFYRDSCYKCEFAVPDRESDITIGDFWNIQKKYTELVDHTGISCIQVNTEKGEKILEGCDSLCLKQIKKEFLYECNGQLIAPTKMPQNRREFLDTFENEKFSILIDRYVGKAQWLNRAISSLLPGKLKRMLRRGKR